jgi:hypothetical protein
VPIDRSPASALMTTGQWRGYVTVHAPGILRANGRVLESGVPFRA